VSVPICAERPFRFSLPSPSPSHLRVLVLNPCTVQRPTQWSALFIKTMPFPVAHPAAVLPLRRYCPRYLSFPALVVGSLSPDLGYLFGHLHADWFSHRFWAGSFGFWPRPTPAYRPYSPGDRHGRGDAWVRCRHNLALCPEAALGKMRLDLNDRQTSPFKLRHGLGGDAGVPPRLPREDKGTPTYTRGDHLPRTRPYQGYQVALGWLSQINFHRLIAHETNLPTNPAAVRPI